MTTRPFKMTGATVARLGFTSLAGPTPAAPVFLLTPGLAVAEVSDLGQPPENDHSNYATVDVVWSKGWSAAQQAANSDPVAFTLCPTPRVIAPDTNKGDATDWRNRCARIASRYDVLFAPEKNSVCHTLSMEFSSRAVTGADQFRKSLIIRSSAKNSDAELTATLSSSHAEMNQETATALCRAAFAHIKSRDRASRYVDISTAFESDPTDRDEVANEAFAAGQKVGPRASSGVVALPAIAEISPWLTITTPKLPWIPDRIFFEAGWGALDTILSRIRYMTTHYWADSNLGTLDYHAAVGYRLMPEQHWSLLVDYHHYETFDGLSYGKTRQEIDLVAVTGRYYTLPAAFLSMGLATFRQRQIQTFWGYDLSRDPGSRNLDYEECRTKTGYGAVVGAGADVIQFGAARQLGVRLEVGPFLIPYSGWDKKRTCGDVLDRELVTTDEGSPDKAWSKPFFLLSTGSVSAYINL